MSEYPVSENSGPSDSPGSKVNLNRAPDLVDESSRIYMKARHLWIAILIIVAVGLGIAVPYVDGMVLVLLVIIVLAVALTIIHPIVGLIAFTIVNFIRPADLVPALEAVPLAKLVGGGTLLIMVAQAIIRRKLFFRYRQTWAITGILITLFLSIPMSYWPSASLQVAVDYTKIILFYILIINLVRNLQRLKVMSLITLVCVLVLAISTLEGYFLDGGRAASAIGAKMFGDANDAALFFVAALPLSAFWLRIRSHAYIGRIMYWLSVAVLFSGTIVTQSRGGFLGLIAVFFFYFLRRRNKIVAAIAIVLMGIIGFVALPTEITDRYETIAEPNQEASASARLHTLGAGLNMMLHRPLNGVGAGAFETAFGTDFRPAGYLPSKWNAPHNTLIQVGAETGLIGLGCFLFLFFFTILQLRRMTFERNELDADEIDMREIRDIIYGSMIGYGVCAFFLTQAHNYLLYYLVAATIVLVDLYQDKDRERTEASYLSVKTDE
ncbi:MAG: O-antigen ligase family protein [candidate division Zixibacteria bacterium]|nr:O-antigen ligase family protein [candidate division Zixibacteria bacterium]